MQKFHGNVRHIVAEKLDRYHCEACYSMAEIYVTPLLTKGLFDYQIRIRIHNESESEVNPTHMLDTPTNRKSFDLPSESEWRFTVNPDLDPIFE